MSGRLSAEELVEEFRWTWIRHEGDVCLAAPIFGTTPGALARRLSRARRAGLPVEFRDSAPHRGAHAHPQE